MVEWKTIGEICSNVFAGGTPSTKREDYYDGDIPWIRSGEIDFNVITKAERNITKDGYNNSSAKMIRKGSVVMAMTGATVAKSAVVEFETTANQSVCALETDESIVNYKYLYYTLANNYFGIKSSAQGALTSLNLAMIKQIEVPVPSIVEQQRIVEILNTFTSSIDNLKKQIAQRRKQYEYYRDQLLDLEGKEGVEMKKLEEACEIRRGIRVVKKQLKDNALYPVFQNSIAPMGYYDQFNRDGNMPYIICAGSSSGSVGYCCTPFWAADDCFTIESSKVNRRYTYYALKKNNNNLFKLVRKGSMPRLPHEAIDNMVIPIPSLQEQSRIVSILDTFEASIANLEAQLSQREKQYEYYRNKLLTFE